MKTLFPLISCLVLSACVSTSSEHPGSSYVETKSGGFLIENRKNIKYSMIYMLKNDFGAEPTYEVLFENPNARGNVIVTKGRVAAGQRELVVESAALPRIKNNKKYEVNLRIFSRGELITEHREKVRFNVPEPLIRKLNLNVY